MLKLELNKDNMNEHAELDRDKASTLQKEM